MEFKQKDPLKKVAIIGAGIAGIGSAKVYKTVGYQVTVFERDCKVGGVWSPTNSYANIATNNPGIIY